MHLDKVEGEKKCERTRKRRLEDKGRREQGEKKAIITLSDSSRLQGIERT